MSNHSVPLSDSELELIRAVLKYYGTTASWDETTEAQGFSYEDFLDTHDKVDKLFKKLSAY